MDLRGLLFALLLLKEEDLALQDLRDYVPAFALQAAVCPAFPTAIVTRASYIGGNKTRVVESNIYEFATKLTFLHLAYDYKVQVPYFSTVKQ